MKELTALEKYTCAACGAQAEWNPGKQQLVCPFCGTVAPFDLNQVTGQVEEIDLVKTLRELPDELRGWKSEKKAVRCRSCKAVSVFDPERVGQRCEFCGSPELVDYQELKAPIRPQSLLPFKVSESEARDGLRRWFGARWFAPGKLKRKALIDTVHGIYLPYWTFDSQAHCTWQAESGYYYYTQETFRDSRGNTQTRTVRHVRWVPSAGSVDHFFDDEAVPGSTGVRLDLLRGVEPFPTASLVPYDAAFLSGFPVEHYQVVLVEAAKVARESMTRQLYMICASQVPGDTHRNLQIQPVFSGQTFKHLLVPVWLLIYQFGRKGYQVVVNGYTGKIAGQFPKSFWKIFFLVVLLVALLMLVLFLNSGSG